MYTASNSAEKKNRPREGVAEGGFGGNSATPERIQKTDSPAVLLVKSRTPHKSFLFLLEEKNRRAQIKKCEENFFCGVARFPSDGGAGFLIGGFAQKMFELRSKNTATAFANAVAEGARFELAVTLRLHRISSPAHSTTLSPLPDSITN